MNRDAFGSALKKLDTKLTILTWMVDLVITLGVLRLLLHA
jgi:hypothetical protein